MKFLTGYIMLAAMLVFQQGLAQDSVQQKQLARLLAGYYTIQDALFSGSGGLAANRADDFIKTANTIDYKLISEGNINALLKDASPISETGDLEIQRKHFANLSDNMAILARTVRFSSDPVYQAYCPMKKAGWLTHSREIRNPYYGTAMPGCGKIVETIDH